MVSKAGEMFYRILISPSVHSYFGCVKVGFVTCNAIAGGWNLKGPPGSGAAGRSTGQVEQEVQHAKADLIYQLND